MPEDWIRMRISELADQSQGHAYTSTCMRAGGQEDDHDLLLIASRRRHRRHGYQHHHVLWYQRRGAPCGAIAHRRHGVDVVVIPRRRPLEDSPFPLTPLRGQGARRAHAEGGRARVQDCTRQETARRQNEPEQQTSIDTTRYKFDTENVSFLEAGWRPKPSDMYHHDNIEHGANGGELAVDGRPHSWPTPAHCGTPYCTCAPRPRPLRGPNRHKGPLRLDRVARVCINDSPPNRSASSPTGPHSDVSKKDAVSTNATGTGLGWDRSGCKRGDEPPQCKSYPGEAETLGTISYTGVIPLLDLRGGGGNHQDRGAGVLRWLEEDSDEELVVEGVEGGGRAEDEPMPLRLADHLDLEALGSAPRPLPAVPPLVKGQWHGQHTLICSRCMKDQPLVV